MSGSILFSPRKDLVLACCCWMPSAALYTSSAVASFETSILVLTLLGKVPHRLPSTLSTSLCAQTTEYGSPRSNPSPLHQCSARIQRCARGASCYLVILVKFVEWSCCLSSPGLLLTFSISTSQVARPSRPRKPCKPRLPPPDSCILVTLVTHC